MDKYIDGTEQTAQKQACTHTESTKQQRQFSGEIIVLSTNGAGKKGHFYAKKQKQIHESRQRPWNPQNNQVMRDHRPTGKLQNLNNFQKIKEKKIQVKLGLVMSFRCNT